MGKGTWFMSLLEPSGVFINEKKNAHLGRAMGNVGYVALIGSVLTTIVVGAVIFFFSAMLCARGICGVGVHPIYLLPMVFLPPIFAIISFLAQSLVLFIFAKIFGGGGDFTTQSYLISLPYAAILLITVILGIMSALCFLIMEPIFTLAGFILSILPLLFWLCGLYPLTLALREAHDYGTIKALLTWLVPVILVGLFIYVTGIIAANFLTQFSNVLPSI